ncbi:hypothetical protein CCO03_04880 [Comamonas serinivorans]|uniref:Uncharacterized protein n=1 Tax=Comamonas serinivorans TaxID=1082851 RepID=A0A1Y0EL04_9BURK|nr:efflux RND transporter periplasmic adaptor subunit [Comamonas serinivorans]ARU04098.1 hypothetical protein CCO03_04880 [Comamonas serinivorans]
MNRLFVSTQRGLARAHLLMIVALLIVGAVTALLILRPASGPSGADDHGHGHGHGKAGHAKGDATASRAGHDEHSDDDHREHGDEAQPAKPSPAAAPEQEVVAMTDAQIQVAGIEIARSAPAPLQTVLTFPGEIKFNEDRSAHIVPRTPGVVEAVHVELGQPVRKGQVLAEIASTTVSDLRAELQAASQRTALARSTYERERQLWQEQISPEQDMQQALQALREAEIGVANARQKLLTLGAAATGAGGGRVALRAPFEGIVVDKHLTLGEAVQESTNAFTVADLSTVWAQLNVPARELEQVRVGELATVRSGASGATAQGRIAYVGVLIGEQTRTAPARVTLPNPQNAWRPGLFVNVEVATGHSQAPVTVSEAAIQTLDGKQVVYLRVPGGFRAQPVELGRRSQGRVEIVQGMVADQAHAAQGSFTVKAEQGKAEASHTH